MFIDTTLHPEMVTGVAGPKERTEFYQDVFGQLRTNGVASPAYVSPQDESAFLHYQLSFIYAQMKEARALYFSRDFLSIMNSIDKKIPFSHLPQNYFGYVHFPPQFIFDGDDFVDGAYFYLGPSDLLNLKGSIFENKNVLAISYICKGWTSFGSLLVATEDRKKLTEILSSYPCMTYSANGTVDSSEMLTHREAIFRTIVNCILYLSCSSAQNAVARLIMPMNMVHNKRLQKLRRKKMICNFSTMPILYIDEAPLKKIMVYSKD
ncbi:MAG: hypothetical protein H8D23_09345, partial [Candidatus Brocadiales bacterium]|nr:hypothetical protein [Candidatus Brocadiales bacterium]